METVYVSVCRYGGRREQNIIPNPVHISNCVVTIQGGQGVDRGWKVAHTGGGGRVGGEEKIIRGGVRDVMRILVYYQMQMLDSYLNPVRIEDLKYIIY